MEISKLFVSLKSLSKRWQMEEIEILGLAAKGELTLSVYFDGNLHEGTYNPAWSLSKVAEYHKKRDNRSLTEEDFNRISKSLYEKKKTLEEGGMSPDEITIHLERKAQLRRIVNIQSGDALRFIDNQPVQVRLVFKKKQDNSVHILTPICREKRAYPYFRRTDIIILNDEVERFEDHLEQFDGSSQNLREPDAENYFIRSSDVWIVRFRVHAGNASRRGP